MGWLMFLVAAMAACVLLWALRFPRRLWTVAATALMLAAAGYAWQGSPTLPGHPVAATAQAGDVDPELIALRDAMFGRFNFSWASFTRADAMSRIGAPDTAARAMILTVRQAPGDPGAWTWLGVKLAENDGNQISPAANFAFERAMALGPNHPGPPFFFGVAYVRQGRFAEARPLWEEALRRTPENASYRSQIGVRLMLLNRFLAAQAGRAPGATPQR
jgi:cytochrome c-type biogenesis protein CcmH